MPHCPILKRPRHNALSILLRTRPRHWSAIFAWTLWPQQPLVVDGGEPQLPRLQGENWINSTNDHKKSIGWITEIFEPTNHLHHFSPQTTTSFSCHTFLIHRGRPSKAARWLLYLYHIGLCLHFYKISYILSNQLPLRMWFFMIQTTSSIV